MLAAELGERLGGQRDVAASAATKVNAVGPSSSSLSDSAPALSAAQLGERVLDDPEAGAGVVQLAARSSAAWGTEIPR